MCGPFDLCPVFKGIMVDECFSALSLVILMIFSFCPPVQCITMSGLLFTNITRTVDITPGHQQTHHPLSGLWVRWGPQCEVRVPSLVQLILFLNRLEAAHGLVLVQLISIPIRLSGKNSPNLRNKRAAPVSVLAVFFCCFTVANWDCKECGDNGDFHSDPSYFSSSWQFDG